MGEKCFYFTDIKGREDRIPGRALAGKVVDEFEVNIE
jgi:hypothetical protein